MRVDRLNNMERYILSKGTVSLQKLAEHFQVSQNTVRRDVAELLNRGRIMKVYGGVSAQMDTQPLNLATRAISNMSEKTKIGRLAAEMVSDESTIFLDSGTTVACMVPYLAEKKDITIITHSLNIMYEAAKYPSLNIISLGGIYSHTTSSFSVSSFDLISDLNADAVFIAATGISLEKGITHNTYFDAETKKRIVSCSDKVILLADDSKFDRSSTISFFNFNSLYAIVTNAKPEQKFLDVIEKEHIKLIYE